ncbi:TetR/AcrR family transcriptional regulator [Desulfosediminicola ganghwensis]|uniref:TetR/AcrR family transcriptional regulator n=1 Tax=Desulfosediminicola ganghwensis TaxID=2569540 RepID=UPI0010AC3318|nr:TetR/AcrR family transcriptional regulator [Desulfosediminicola ganghwensis]
MSDTRTKILDVAEDLVQTVGVNAMSYKHISEAVGIRKASIHHHFPKKEDLVDELLKRCQTTYGENYRAIVDEDGTAPEKLRKLAGVFEQGLLQNKLCLVGSISTDKNTLPAHSCDILKDSIKMTVSIFATVFAQGREDNSLRISGTDEEVAYTFLSFLVGTQIVARSHGGDDMFNKAAEIMIKALEC